MTDDMLDILMYVFDQYDNKSFNIANERSVNQMARDLLMQGFSEADINHGLRWLDETRKESAKLSPCEQQTGMRIYDQEESAQLSGKARAFLYQLEAHHVLTPTVRELIIDRAMSLNSFISLEQCKWIAAIVLYNYNQEQPSELEELMFYDFENATMH